MYHVIDATDAAKLIESLRLTNRASDVAEVIRQLRDGGWGMVAANLNLAARRWAVSGLRSDLDPAITRYARELRAIA